MLLLNNDDVAAVIGMDECIAAIEAAYRELDAGQAAHRPRATFHVSQGADDRYTLATMDGVSRSAGFAALRVRSDFVTRDAERGTERKFAAEPGSFCGLVLLFDISNAAPVAILNDGWIQQLRVGATAAVAARRMARASSRVLGIIGSGNQARSHARAYAAIRDLDLIRVHSPNADGRQRFAEEMSAELGIRVEPMEDARSAVAEADLVAICTNATRPVLDASWLAPGTHLSSVRHRHEVGPDLLDRADRVVLHVSPSDTTFRVGRDATSGMEAFAPTPTPGDAPTLVDLVSGRESGRHADEEVTYFLNNVGTGLQFAACAGLAYRRAVEVGRGRKLPAEWFLQDLSD